METGQVNPLIVAHRGLHDAWPENSLEAFRAAWRAGWLWAECDVHRSKNDEIIVIHDQTLDRTTIGSGKVANYSWPELAGIRLKNRDGGITECRLPRLIDLWDQTPIECGLFVEIKPAHDEKCVRRVVEMCNGRRCLIHSFDADNLHRVHRQAPHLATAFLVDDERQWPAALDGPWESVILHHQLVTLDRVRAIEQTGKRWGVWTVNEEADARRVLSLGANVVITDRPAMIRAVLDSP